MFKLNDYVIVNKAKPASVFNGAVLKIGVITGAIFSPDGNELVSYLIRLAGANSSVPYDPTAVNAAMEGQAEMLEAWNRITDPLGKEIAHATLATGGLRI
jgi:hypothetical protein